MIQSTVKYQIYLFKDLHGNNWATSINDRSYDQVFIPGLKNKNGVSVTFESEAYHLDKWSKENDIEMKVIDRKEDFNGLWGNN